MLPKKRNYINIFILIVSIIIILLIINLIRFNKKTTKLIRAAQYLSNNQNNKGITYYVSEDGTSEDGTDINNPMSMEIANQKQYYGNDKVLLKRGDIFYTSVNFNVSADEDNLFYIGAYGDENLEKPIISGAMILKNEEAWKLENGLYKLDLSNHTYLDGYVETDGIMYNVGFLEDENGNIYGNRKETTQQLENDYDFCCVGKYLYVKSKENPTKLLGTIKLPLRHNLVCMPCNTILENLCIEDTGAHGIVRKGEPLINAYIGDCIIRNIGGSYQYTSGNTRYGNGIEFWNQAENTIVTKCIIKNIYDAGYTLQGAGTSLNGFKNNICQDNIFINCTYSIEMSTTNVEDSNFENNKINNNIMINQGKGWGYEARNDKFQPANLVIWRLPNNKSGLQYSNNRIYNSRALYYYNYDENIFKNIMDADNNKYYLAKDSIMFINKEYQYDKQYLYDYNVDKNSMFEILSEEDIEQLTNEVEFSDMNYEELLEYFNFIDTRYKSQEQINKIIKKLKDIENNKVYSNLLENELVKKEFDNILNKISIFLKSGKDSNRENLTKLYNELYDWISTIINELNNNSIESVNDYELWQIIKDIDNLTDYFKNIFSIYIYQDDISSNSVAINLNNVIINYNKDTNLMSNIKNIILKAKDIYLNQIQNKESYANYLNKQRINNLCKISNEIMQYNIELENEKKLVKVIYNQDKNKKTSTDMIVTVQFGDKTKILNNNGINTYTFNKNGAFTFYLSIKGKTHALAITIKNIEKKELDNIIVKDLYKKQVNSKKIEIVKVQYSK